MSAEATPAPDPDVAMLARLAALDMAAAEHAHGRLMAATDAQEINDLGRTYERFARSLRRTLALKAKLAHDAALAAERREARARREDIDDEPDDPTHARVGELQDAVDRITHAHGVTDGPARERLHERLDAELWDWAERDDFAGADLDAQVRWLCGRLGLPAELAAAWRDLPQPDADPPPWADDAPPPADDETSISAASQAPTHPPPLMAPGTVLWRGPLPPQLDSG